MILDARTVASFESRLEPDPFGGCLLWSGYTMPFGHGQIKVGGRKGPVLLTHRLAWMIYKGPIPEGFNVLHSCDVPPCCEPRHLFLGTHADNVDDMVTKGRHARGESLWKSRLTDLAIYEILERLSRGESQRSIAMDFDIDASAISRVANNKTWRHLPRA